VGALLGSKHVPLPPTEFDSGNSIEMIHVSRICTGRIPAIALFGAFILNDIYSTTANIMPILRHFTPHTSGNIVPSSPELV
jgi:hypothetical protein